ncbi:hypothetical protein HS088_TW23G00222 [Tripterygium wilfordii]|uniref:Alpha/beta-Hydrolases superfamily protein n=1 Tax=Tripterygium wilfordii TaxID=458696 RepID=A0A7J7BU84_TRIWF|nr:hypothetical protein HS088_TW23G00222 [Tripterygium wilfordii]
MSNCTVESFAVETSDGVKFHTRGLQAQGRDQGQLGCGSCASLFNFGWVSRLLRGIIAAGLADKGYRAPLTGFAEIKDVGGCLQMENLFFYLMSAYGTTVVGSGGKLFRLINSPGRCKVAIALHYKAVLKSPKPKLFVMGTRDEFTSVKQLESKLRSACGRVEKHLIEGAGHFEMEGPDYDTRMVNLISEFIASL